MMKIYRVVGTVETFFVAEEGMESSRLRSHAQSALRAEASDNGVPITILPKESVDDLKFIPEEWHDCVPYGEPGHKTLKEYLS